MASQFHYYSGEPFVKLGTPLLKSRMHILCNYSIVFELLNCCQKVHQAVIQSLLHIKRMACNSQLIYMATSQTGSTANVGACASAYAVLCIGKGYTNLQKSHTVTSCA